MSLGEAEYVANSPFHCLTPRGLCAVSVTRRVGAHLERPTEGTSVRLLSHPLAILYSSEGRLWAQPTEEWATSMREGCLHKFFGALSGRFASAPIYLLICSFIYIGIDPWIFILYLAYNLVLHH